jgi:alkanesulfonate monooxygenase SsuD/methylene tetrahydromethanopterin reductase-like flavin-dependent oxidoreductase (luciferase family)
VRYAFNFPLFDHLSDERVLAELAHEAEQSGWDAVLVWDHVNLHQPGMANGGPHAEPWIALAMMAQSTKSVLLGTCITPVARRRPVKLVREILALHRLSNGRFMFGAGLGVGQDEFDDLGEQPDLPTRGDMLDESLEIISAALSGTPVEFDGEHYQIHSPTALDEPADVPIWLAGTWPNKKPFRRAARYDGMYAMKVGFVDPLTPQDVAAISSYIQQHREGNRPFSLAVGANTTNDKAQDRARAAALSEAGANWWLDGTLTTLEDLQALRSRLHAGPPV